MGAKASTASGANSASSTGQHHNQHMLQSPRTRTFSTSSSSTAADVVGNSATGSTAGFSLLRAIPGMHITAANQSAADRQRAHSLSSVPDMQQNNGGTTASGGPSNYLAANNGAVLGFAPNTTTFQQVTVGSESDSIAAATAGALALGRVYAASSLPSHIWSLNGKFNRTLCMKFPWQAKQLERNRTHASTPLESAL